MNCIREYAPIAFVLFLTVTAGCQWMSPNSSDDWDLTDAERDSLQEYFSTENKRLISQVESQKLDLVKIKAAYQQQTELNEFLSEELKNSKEDLDRFERQFVIFEQRLKVTETKASAVAAVAEVHLLFDRLRTETPDGLDSLTVSEVSLKLNTSEELIKKRNYAAATYFADRAMKILNQAERRNNLSFTDGTTRVISVRIANMRDGPGSTYRVIDKLVLGTVVVHLESSENWIKIRTESGKNGWVHDSLIR